MVDVHFCHRATAVVVLLLLLLHLVVFATVAHSQYPCDWCPPRHSTVSLLSTHAGRYAGGACGYGAAPMELSAAAVTADLFRDGHACGACYQLRCRDRRLCGEDGVKVVVANLVRQPEQEETNRTADGSLQFRITKDAFAAMAKHDGVSAHELTSLRTAQVDFRRVPCEYNKSRSLAVRVEEASANPSRLAVRFLYQGGQTDIAAVEIAPANATPSSWRYMTRRDGVVWSTPRAPAGPLRLRVVVTAGSGGKWLRSDGEVLPAEWKPGEVYDTGLRVTDVAVRSCSLSCGTTPDSHGDGDGGEELR
ncbi:expansin-like A4 [Oryza brachyantha]|uniref:Expansin-like EG45 domain-containing protein n=1 Tax=Oryza brachyantha TaxID=4533 RepID=J3MHS1_ORYBR|nr:expansin-like A4 [Oryza brachyantha]